MPYAKCNKYVNEDGLVKDGWLVETLKMLNDWLLTANISASTRCKSNEICWKCSIYKYTSLVELYFVTHTPRSLGLARQSLLITVFHACTGYQETTLNAATFANIRHISLKQTSIFMRKSKVRNWNPRLQFFFWKNDRNWLTVKILKL